MFWGFSEAFDFIEDLDVANIASEEPINILLFGSGDPRNILKTIAKSYKHSRKIHFYLVEGCMEIIARQMLLLAIAFEDPKNFSLQNKTHLFMDIYGNSLLRPFSYNYIASKAEVLLKIMTDQDYQEKMAPIFSFENLKYRERDNLEKAFTFWQPKPKHIFPIDKHWNHLIRKKLGTRYDHRDGAFDWDLQMVLKYNGCKQICSQEYRHWRETGIAFTFPEYEHSEPNKTLAAGIIQNGTQFLHRGYVGDTEVGPYCAFGLSVLNDAQMSNSVHGSNDYRATDLTERNLLEIFSEIHNRGPYIHDQKSSRKLGSVLLALGKPITGPGCESVNLKSYDDPFLDCPNIKIYIQSLNDVFELERNRKFSNFFHAVFVANNYFPLVKDLFASTLKVNANVYFETKQYTIMRNEIIADFLKNVKLIAKNMKLKSLTHFNINAKNSIVKFQNADSLQDNFKNEKEFEFEIGKNDLIHKVTTQSVLTPIKEEKQPTDLNSEFENDNNNESESKQVEIEKDTELKTGSYEVNKTDNKEGSEITDGKIESEPEPKNSSVADKLFQINDELKCLNLNQKKEGDGDY